MLIYLADDELKIQHMLERYLKKEGFEVVSFSNGKDLLEAFIQTPCQLIITDIMMPVMDGYDLCLAIRKRSNVPLVILSAKNQEEDRIRGLELGSDDYISKPFSLKELGLKVKRMLQRYEATLDQADQVYQCMDLKLDIKAHAVFGKEDLVHLTEKEFQLLELLIVNKNQAFSRADIIDSIWGVDYIEDTRLLDHLVKRLRKKLIKHRLEFSIETIWGFGYKAGTYEDKK